MKRGRAAPRDEDEEEGEEEEEAAAVGENGGQEDGEEEEEEEAEEEEEEDDEEEEEEDRGRRKRKRRAGAELFEEEADVAEDDEEEEEEEGEEGFIIDEGTELDGDGRDGGASARAGRHPRPPLMGDEAQTDEDLEAYIQKRYAPQEYEEYEEGEANEVEQQANLPDVKDPKLWMLRCKVGPSYENPSRNGLHCPQGHEREAVVSLMQKFINLDTPGQRLLIKSAVARDDLKGFIYVEAERESHVRQACKGLRLLYAWKIDLVPIKEMPDVLTVDKKVVEIDRDMWVRVKNGIYKGDLAQVVDVNEVAQQATIKLIPRVDLHLLAARLEEREDAKRKRPRPPARFFTMEEVQDLRIPVERKRDPLTGELFEQFCGMRFKDGYFYKTLSLRTLDTKGIIPTLDELQKFQRPGADGDSEDPLSLGLVNGLATKLRGQFIKGDVVEVVEGDLKRLMGTVEKVENDMVSIRAKDTKLKDLIPLKANQLKKFFKIGDHVKVIAGQHDGTSGLLVSVQESVVVVLSDTTREQVKVLARDIVESSEVASGLTRIGEFELHDLVALDRSNFGLIVKVEKDGCLVLRGKSERQEVTAVHLRELRRKIFDRQHQAQDRNMASLCVKDPVRIVDGPFKEKQGPIEHIHNDWLFIHDRSHTENGGYIGVAPFKCQAVGGGARGLDLGRPQPPAMLNVLRSPSHLLQSPRRNAPGRMLPGPGMFGGGRHGQRRVSGLVGKTVRIKAGPYKSYKGRVVDATDTTARVELESQMKVVTVRLDQLPDTESMQNPFSTARESPQYDQTPHHPSRTPMHNYMATPLRDPTATPMHDGMRTPMRDRAWNPQTPMTPIRSNTDTGTTAWDEADPSTWQAPNPTSSGYAASTPGVYNAGTPGGSSGGGYVAYTPFSPTEQAGTPQDGSGKQPGTPGGRMYEAPTPGGGWTPGGGAAGTSYNDASNPYDVNTPYGGNAPSPSPYFPGTPGGGGQPMTPGAYPSTPGGQPMTPGDHYGDGAGGPAWGLPEVIVTVRRQGDESPAVIKELLPDGSCLLALGASGEGAVVTASHADLTLVMPKKGDRIRIMSGDLRGSYGKLKNINNQEGIVELADTFDIKFLHMSSLGKLAS
eukprot:SM000026S08975  [mRNA]  locus=s26:804898:812869:+ [translate_table: standard]